jgi:hypothetical protein
MFNHATHPARSKPGGFVSQSSAVNKDLQAKSNGIAGKAKIGQLKGL